MQEIRSLLISAGVIFYAASMVGAWSFCLYGATMTKMQWRVEIERELRTWLVLSRMILGVGLPGMFLSIWARSTTEIGVDIYYLILSCFMVIVFVGDELIVIAGRQRARRFRQE